MTPTILALDSGIGGLTIVAGIRRILPGVAIQYLADSAGFPYGGMTTDQLVGRLTGLIGAAIETLRPDAVVIACNTATTMALDSLRRSFDLPFVGVVPPIKTAGELSRNRCIGLMATTGTATGPYVDRLIGEFAADCRVIRAACPGLAELAEDKARGRAIDEQALRRILTPLSTPEADAMDTVVLGCTHYPILLDDLRAVLPRPAYWLDSAEPVARRLKTVLRERGLDGTQPGNGKENIAWFTGGLSGTADLLPFLRDHGFPRAEAWVTD